MKKITLITILVLMGAFSVGAFFPDTSTARVFAVFGPETFVRSTKGPETEMRQFPVQYPRDSEFTLHAFYGGITKDLKETPPSALIVLNGHQVVGPDEFNSNGRYIKKPVTLSGGNSLSVELRGKPGSGIRVMITGKNNEPQQFDFREVVHPDGSNLFGPDVIYDWTIVHQPEGGKAIMDNPSSPTPSLDAMNVPGKYSLELKVRSDSWEESFLVELTAMDMLTTTYNDTPYVPVPVKSRVVTGTGTDYSDYSIQVGSTSYTAPYPTSCGSPSNSGFQILVLDRATLAKKDHKSFNVPCGDTNMVNFLDTLDSTSLVILSSLNNAEPKDVCANSSSCPLGAKLKDFGATNIFPAHYSETLSYHTSSQNPFITGDPVTFTYSLIGIRGLGQDQGVELNNADHYLFVMSSKIYSNISGYFVQDVNQQWAFVYPEFVEIQTHAATTATSNTIKVGNVSYVSAPLKSGAAGGFQVLFLDRDTLAPTEAFSAFGYNNNMTFSTNAGSLSESEQSTMTITLETYRSWVPKAVVVIASIGTPINCKAGCYWDLANAIRSYYGGSVGVFNQLGGTSTKYSLVGLSEWSAQYYSLGANDAVEGSTSMQNLRVVLHKDKQGWYSTAAAHEDAAGTTSPPDFSLLSVALQAPTPWPLPDASLSTSDPVYKQQLAAYQYISNHVGEGTNNDIRSKYTKSPINPSNWITYCNLLSYPTTTPPEGYFTQDVFNTMKTQLCGASGEFNYVSKVNGFMDDLDTVLLRMQLSSNASLLNVYNAVKATIRPPDSSPILYSALKFVSNLLFVRANIAESFSDKATLGTINAGLIVALHHMKTPTGADYTSVNTTALSLVNEMDNLWKSCQAGKDIVLDMVKSDWGKLQYVGNKFMTPQDQGGWEYSDTDTSNWVTYITNSLEAYYFQALLPAVYKIDYLERTLLPKPCNYCYGASDIWCWPYRGCPESAYEADQFSDGTYSWYVLRDSYSVKSGCNYVYFNNSTSLRDILFGQGDWLDSSGNYIGVKLNLSKPVFFQSWLPSSIYSNPYVCSGCTGGDLSRCGSYGCN